MAFSKSTNFIMTSGEVINEALALCGIGLNSETPTAAETNQAKLNLNMLVKMYSVKGLKPWLKGETTVTMIANQASYNLGYNKDGTTTATTANKLVDSGAGFTSDGTTIGDQVINVTDGTTTTVSAIDSDTTLSVAADIFTTGEQYRIARTGNTVIDRPVEITRAWLRDSNNVDTPVTVIPKNDHLDLNDKATAATPTMLYYNPLIKIPQITLWPKPTATDVSNYTLYLHFRKFADDIDATTDDIEFPQEWYLALVWNLAEVLMIPLDLPEKRQNKITGMAKRFLNIAESTEVETHTSVKIQPSSRRR